MVDFGRVLPYFDVHYHAQSLVEKVQRGMMARAGAPEIFVG